MIKARNLPTRLHEDPFSLTGAGWPTGINDANPVFPAGSIRVSVNAVCYPDAASELAANEQFWQFNTVSPDLMGNADWQGIDGISFRAITNLPGVQVQATVVFEDENGDDAYASPAEYTAVSNSWLIVDETGYVPDRPIRRILIRVFGEPEWLQGTAGGTVLVDVVSPIP